MNEHLRKKTTQDAGATAAVGFMLGVLVGAGVALLVAPASGRETRRRVADAGGRMGDATREALGQARDAAKDLGRDVKSAWSAEREKLAPPSPAQAPGATPTPPPEGVAP